ncbi:MAG: MBL fold metallo-hydrolase [Oscillospiraceae bacterium]|nr:MBL fold metallo-hydrolase [Oscillospiraceae bacterium]
METYKVLDIQFEHQGSLEHIYPVLLLGGSDTVLVDCGYPGFMNLIEAELQKQGVSPSDLTKIVLTHQDDDHMGAAKEFISKYPHIQIAASSMETPYIEGREKNLRLKQAEELQAALPEDMQEFGKQFCNRLRQVQPVPVDLELHDGDCFDWGGGCKIISTPGHTPGHISLLLPKEGTLITGDAAVVEDNELVLANPQFCLDIEEAGRSLANIKGLVCRQGICDLSGMFRI